MFQLESELKWLIAELFHVGPCRSLSLSYCPQELVSVLFPIGSSHSSLKNLLLWTQVESEHTWNLVVYGPAGELFPGFIALTPHLLAWHLLLGRLTPRWLQTADWRRQSEWQRVGGNGGLASAGSRTHKDAHEEDLVDHVSLLGRLWDEMGPQFCLSLAAPIDWSAANQC